MAFEKRETTAEEAEELRKYAPVDPFVSRRDTNFFIQVYDKERNILLVHVGGRGSFTDEREYPCVFMLLWNENVCAIECFEKHRKCEDGGYHFTWYIKEIYAPSQLREKSKGLTEIIKEAIEAYGFADLPWKVNLVEFAEVAEPKFIGETGWRYARRKNR